MKNILIFTFFLFINVLQAQILIPQQDKKGLFGYRKTDSKRWIIKPTFQEVKRFGELGLDSSFAFAKQNNLWGVIDQKGKWKVVPRYNEVIETDGKRTLKVELFYEYRMVYLSTSPNEFDILDKYANIKLQNCNAFSLLKEGFMMVEKKGKQTLYKIEKNMFYMTSIQDCDGIWGSSSQNIVATFRKNDLRGIYKSETQILKGYNDLTILNQKSAIAKKGKEYEIINLESFSVKKIGDFDNLTPKRDVLFVTKNNLKGIIGIQGETILPIEYSEISSFNYSSDFYVISKNGLKGLFDMSENKLVFPAQFEKIEELTCNNNIYVLTQKGQNTLYDKYKKQIIKEQIQEIKCLDANKFNSTLEYIMLLKINNKQAVLKWDEQGWIISDFFDKIEVLEGKHNSWDGIYDELIVYKNKQKLYLNVKNYSIYKKPLLQNYETIQERPEEIVVVDRPSERNNNQTDQADDKVYQEFEVSENAEYEGGINAFRKDIQRKLEYPQKAKNKKTEGIVTIQFTVNKQGSIEDINVIKDIGDGCGEAAMEAIKKVKNQWTPARNAHGQPIKVRKTIPIVFKLL